MFKKIALSIILLGLCALARADIFGPVDELRYLIDVNVTAPANNEVLTYNSTQSKWINRVAGGLTNGTDISWDGNLSTTGNITVTSLTAGSVLFGGTAGVLAQDNANLFWDDANNRLGIGTTTPSSKLTVSSTGAGLETISLIRKDSGASPVVAYGFDVTSSALGETAATKAGIGFERNAGQGGGDMSFYVDSNTDTGSIDSDDIKMTILRLGNVGIGTTAPSTKLQVSQINDGGAGGILTLHNVAATESAGTYTGINFDVTSVYDTYKKGGIYYSIPSSGYVGYGKGDIVFAQNTANSIDNAIPADAVMTIKNSGNVGIGTTTPAVALDVNGGINASGYVNATNVPFKKTFLTVVFNNQTAVTLPAVAYFVVPLNVTITDWVMYSNNDTTASAEVWLNRTNGLPTVADAINGTEKPTLTAANISNDMSLTSMNVTWNKGDRGAVNLTANDKSNYIGVYFNATYRP